MGQGSAPTQLWKAMKKSWDFYIRATELRNPVGIVASTSSSVQMLSGEVSLVTSGKGLEGGGAEGGWMDGWGSTQREERKD